MIDDLRKTVEGLIETLTPAKAQQMAKDMLEPGVAKEHVAKTTADLMEWSLESRERLTAFVRREISEQLQAVGGVASRAEVDALAARVRDLERAAEPAERRQPARSASKRVTSGSGRSSSRSSSASSSASRAGARSKAKKSATSTDEGAPTSSDG